MSRWVSDSPDYREPSSRVSLSSNAPSLIGRLLLRVLLRKRMLALEAGEICIELPMRVVISSGPIDLRCHATKLGTRSMLVLPLMTVHAHIFHASLAFYACYNMLHYISSFHVLIHASY